MIKKFNKINDSFERKTKVAVLHATLERYVLLIQEGFFLFRFVIGVNFMDEELYLNIFPDIFVQSRNNELNFFSEVIWDSDKEKNLFIGKFSLSCGKKLNFILKFRIIKFLLIQSNAYGIILFITGNDIHIKSTHSLRLRKICSKFPADCKISIFPKLIY